MDDHALMCQGLRAILEPEYEVVGEVHEGEGVLAAVASLHPDDVLLDLSLPGKSGTEVLQDLLVTTAPPAVVILTIQADACRLNAALAPESGSQVRPVV